MSNNIELLKKYRIENDIEAYKEIIVNNSSLIYDVIKKNIIIENMSIDDIVDEYFMFGYNGLCKAIDNVSIKNIDEKYFLKSLRFSIESEIFKNFSNGKNDPDIVSLDEEMVIDEDDFLWKTIVLDSTEKEEDEENEEYKEYKEYKYKKIEDAINKLSSMEVKIIEHLFGFNNKEILTVEEIGEKYSIRKDNLNKIIRQLKNFFVEELKEFEEEYKKQKKNQKVYKLVFLEKEILDCKNKYGEKVVEESISKLSDYEKEMLNLYFKTTGDELKKIEKTSILIKKSEYYTNKMYQVILNKIKKNMNFDNYIKRIIIFNSLIKKYGDEQINNALKKIDEEEKRLLEVYCGINGNTRESIEFIEQKFNISKGQVNKTVRKIYKKIVNIIENTNVNKDRSEELFEMFETYGKSEILDKIESLKEKDKLIIKMYYGLDGYSEMSKREIWLKLGVPFEYINSLIADFKKNKLVSEKKMSMIDELYNLYGKKFVDKKIRNLSKEKRYIIQLYYGINQEREMNYNQIWLKTGDKFRNIKKIIDEFKKDLGNNQKNR